MTTNGTKDTAATIKWASSNPSIATVSDSGMVTLVAAGNAQISATAGGVTASASAVVSNTPAPVSTVRVSPASVSLTPGQYTPLTAVPFDASGDQLTGRVVTWASSNTSIATVSSSGIVTAVAVGAAIITATSEGISGTSSVTVAASSPAPVASVTVTPSSTSLTIGSTAQLTATDKDASGDVLAGRAITWASSNSGVVSVSSSGVVTAVAAGSATITATSGGKTGSATVTASEAAVASVSVTPATSNLTPGQTAQLTATAYDASGNVLTGRAVTWAIGPASVATVSGTGLVTAVAVGTAKLTATIGGQSGTASITVGPAPVAHVTVSPTQASIGVGKTQQLTASATTASGAAATGVSYTWSSSSTSTASVSSTGLVTGVAAGSATVTVSSNGLTATAAITVTGSTTNNTVASVSVSPSSSSLTVGNTVTLTATDKNSSGTTVTGTTPTWASSNTGVASVSSSGVVTAVAAGSATITATSSSKSGTAAITVTTATSTGSGSYANQPAGATTITERRFDAVAEDGWPSPILANGGTAAITMDPAAPKSPDSVMQVTYPTGYPAGTTPFDQSVRTGGNYTQFYGSVWLKYSSGFAVDNAGILKILYIWGDDEMPSLCLCVNNYSGGNGNFTPQLGLQDATNVNLVPNVSGQVGYGFPTGQWVRLEFFLQMNTPGNSDGIAKVWANGVLVSNYTNVNYIAGSTQHYWWKYELAPYWGGAGGTVATPQYVWFDHLYGSGH